MAAFRQLGVLPERWPWINSHHFDHLGVGREALNCMNIQVDPTTIIVSAVVILAGFMGTVITIWNLMSNRLTRLETQSEKVWQDVVLDASKILHKSDPSKKHMDNLLEKSDADILSEQEIVTLIIELKKRIIDESLDAGTRIASSILLRATERGLPKIAKKVNGITVVNH